MRGVVGMWLLALVAALLALLALYAVIEREGIDQSLLATAGSWGPYLQGDQP